MITPDTIRKKAENYYKQYLSNIVSGISSFPWEIRFGKIRTTEEYSTIKKYANLLLEQSKNKTGYGYEVDLKTSQTRKYGGVPV